VYYPFFGHLHDTHVSIPSCISKKTDLFVILVIIPNNPNINEELHFYLISPSCFHTYFLG